MNKQQLELLEKIAGQAEEVRRLQKTYIREHTQTALEKRSRAEHRLDFFLAKRIAEQTKFKKEIYKQERFTHEVTE